MCFFFHQEHHENEQEDEHSPEQIQLMQTQDIKYITMKKTIEANKIQKMQSELHMIDEANKVKNTHILFTDSGDEDTEIDLAKRLNTHPSLLHRRTNRPRLEDLNKIDIKDDEIEVSSFVFHELYSICLNTNYCGSFQINLCFFQVARKLYKKREESYNELKNRIEREKMLTVAQQKMTLKKVLQQKRLLKPKRIAPGTKDSAPVYLFKYERKK